MPKCEICNEEDYPLFNVRGWKLCDDCKTGFFQYLLFKEVEKGK
jgi:hypothetical protein